MPSAEAARVVAQTLGLDADRERKFRVIIESERARRANKSSSLERAAAERE